MEHNRNIKFYLFIIILLSIITVPIILYLKKINTKTTIVDEDNTSVIFDPISQQNYYYDYDLGLVDGDENIPDSPNFLNFGKLPDEFFKSGIYQQLTSEINSYINKTFNNKILYVSLDQNSIDQTSDHTYTFTIYFNSESPANVTVDLSDETNPTIKFN